MLGGGRRVPGGGKGVADVAELAGHLPGLPAEAVERETLRFSAWGRCVEVAAPLLTHDQVTALTAHVRRSRERFLARLRTEEVADILDRAVRTLLDRSNPRRRRAEELLPAVTGYDPETVRLGLTSYLKTFRGAQLSAFVAEDFANPRMLDGFQPLRKGGYGRAFGPALTAHIWAGNVPGLPLWSLVSGLLVKSANIGKLPSAEPLFAGWFAEAVAEIEPRLADCIGIVWWKGGDEDRQQALLDAADLVLAYGGGATLERIRARVPITARFLPFGHKLSFGTISAAALDADKAACVARQAALDIVRYDQHGCYSPHVFYVERGGAVGPRAFAGYLGGELAALSRRFPRRALDADEAADLAASRQDAELRSVVSDSVDIAGDPEGAWSVVFAEDDPALAPGGSNRTVKVAAVDRLDAAIPEIARHAPWLQTVGVAATPEELFRLSALLGEAGASRICALGEMTAPEAGWHHDGRFNLLDLVRIVEIERGAEAAAEDFAEYRD